MNKFSLQKSIIFCIFVLAICLIYLFSSKFLDTRVNDIFTRTFNILFGKQSSDNVVLVVIDDKSASEIKWPWTRDLYSYIFNNNSCANLRHVLFAGRVSSCRKARRRAI